MNITRLRNCISLNIFFVVAIFCTNLTYASEDWYSCKTVSECTMVQGHCGVEWAVRKEFAQKSRANPPREDAFCTKPRESHPSTTFAICADGKCILYPAGTYAGGKKIDEENCVVASCWGHLGCNYLTCTHRDGAKFTKYAN